MAILNIELHINLIGANVAKKAAKLDYQEGPVRTHEAQSDTSELSLVDSWVDPAYGYAKDCCQCNLVDGIAYAKDGRHDMITNQIQ